MGNILGKSAAVVKGKNKFIEIRERPLAFSEFHDDHISISEDSRTARWGIKKGNTDGEGRCYSNRTLKVDEQIRLSVRGSGFFDLGLSNVHPGRLLSNKDFVCKYITSKVLFFEPVELQLHVGPEGTVFFTDGNEQTMKLKMGIEPSSHWLAVKMGCGEVTVTFVDEETEESSSDSDCTE